MPPKSKHYEIQSLLYNHFNGDKNIAVYAVIIYLNNYDKLTCNILIDRFKNKYTFSKLSNRYNYDICHLQRIIDNKIYKKLYEYLYVLKRLDI